MPYGFGDKDYGDYFKKIEDSLQSDNEKQKVFSQSKATTKKEVTKARVRLRPSFVAAVCIILVITVLLISVRSCSKEKESTTAIDEKTSSVQQQEDTPQPENQLIAKADGQTASIPTDYESSNIIVVNCQENLVVAARQANTRCYPASTTKIMTLLVAVENTKDFDDTFTMSYEITDPLYVTNTTVAGFCDGEEVTITDMLYGAILPSGADACIGLAIKTAGSEEKFVQLMNEKARELGLKDTHFTNTSGVFDEQHYTTAADMAVIIRAAMQNKLCKKVLSTYQHTTEKTPENPDGIQLTSTLFSYMYGNEPEGSDILGGKTGFVNESGYCIATFGETDGGKEYVCVTLGGNGVWPTVKDQINLYTAYAK